MSEILGVPSTPENSFEIEHGRLERPFRVLLKALDQATSHPSPKLVHTIRTESRKVETTLQVLGVGENDRRLLKALVRLRKRAGRVRDVDVIASLAASLPADEAPILEQDCQAELLQYLDEKRARKARKLNRFIRDHQHRLRTLKKVSFGGRKSRENWNTSALAAAAQLEEDLAAAHRLTRQHLHAYRTTVRRLRFLLRLEGKLDSDFIDSLGEVKDSIGAWHDWALLEETAQAVSAHAEDCRLIELIRSQESKKFADAISTTARMQQKYLPPGVLPDILDSGSGAQGDPAGILSK